MITASGGRVTVGTPGAKPSASPPTTSRIGYGMLQRVGEQEQRQSRQEQQQELKLFVCAEAAHRGI